MFFSEFPFLRYAFFMVIGICAYPVFPDNARDWLVIGIISVYAVYVVLVLVNVHSRKYGFRFILPTLAYIQLTGLGALVCFQKDIRHQPDHLLREPDELRYFLATTQDWDEPKARSNMNRLALKASYGTDWKGIQAEILLYHQAKEGLKPDQAVLVAGSPQEIPHPANPGQFDYRAFMLRQGIAHSHFAGERVHILGEVAVQPIQGFFSNIRRSLLKRIEEKIVRPESQQIAKALLLGYKKEMDTEITQAYSVTGAMHILAVSGLHVGIIYGFFFLFVKPYRLQTKTRILYLSVLILLIWAYASITGLSPSVMRAATMFTFASLAQMQSRSPSIFNAIALSALVLLLYDPFLLYAVGFQLSYLALIGILLLQPRLVKLWLPRYRWLEYCWQISTVGIAAQLATFPVSAYYFHQFPSYFIVSNLVAIPAAFLIMAIGIPFLIFSSVPFLSPILAWLTESLIRVMNFLIFWMESWPAASIKDIQFEFWEMAAYASILGCGILLWNFPRKSFLWTFLGMLGLFGFVRIGVVVIGENQNQLTWYRLDQGQAMDLHYRQQLWTWEDADPKELTYNVLANRGRYPASHRWPLHAFKSQGRAVLLGPGDLGLIETNPALFPEENRVYAWKNGDWVAIELSEAKSPETALKFLIQ